MIVSGVASTPAGRMFDTMIDPALLRERSDEVRARLEQRGASVADQLDFLTRLDAERREILPVLENARRERKELGGQIARAKKEGRPVDDLMTAGQVHGEQIKEQEDRLEKVEHERHALLLMLPNLAHESVPVGVSEADNQEVRRVGEPTVFDFEPKAHSDLGPALGILDFDRATRMSGARFSVLMGAGARLARALINFMLELHTGEHGYVEVEPPFLVKSGALDRDRQPPEVRGRPVQGAGRLGPLSHSHRGGAAVQSPPGGDPRRGPALPLRYAAYTPCFRSEAGSYGKGHARPHPTASVRQGRAGRLCASPDESYAVHEQLTGHAEEVLRRLGLPFRTVVLCTGDMGFASAKTYDLEVWLPGQSAYREISSCSNTEAFQARRANIRFRRDTKAKPEHVHTLNGSGRGGWSRLDRRPRELSAARDGSVVVPEVLRPYMGGLEVIEPTGCIDPHRPVTADGWGRLEA